MWFRSVLAALGPARSVNRSHRGKKAAARRLGARRLLLEGLEDRHLLAFDVAVDYPAGNSPQAVITADFNSDGRLDVATANSGSSNMSVLLGNADGTFQAARTSATGVGPTTLLASDLNRDGQTDLVTMNLSDAYGSSGDLSVLLGNGDGTFQPPRTVVLPAQFPPGYTGASPVSQAPRFLALGDLDADGTLDLVAAGRTRYSTVIGYDEYGVPILADYYHMYVNVFPGIGNGSFATGVAQQVSIGSPSGLYLGDFDRDGRTDVVTGGGLHVSVLRGNGDGTLQDPQQSNVGWAWFTNISNPVADFDRDGNLDLLMRDGSGNFAVIMYGNGDGSFRRSSEVYLGTTINSAVVGDVNADDNLDIVVTNVNTEYGWCDDYDCYDPVSTRSAVALLGYGNGTFASPVTSDLGTVLAESGFSSVTLGDFDGNGLLDVAASDNFQNAVAVSLNDGVWAEPPPTIIINDVTVVEGNTGTTPAVFTVTLSAPWHQELTVDYATLTGHTDDIVATSGTLRFAPGQTSNTITVEVIGDSLVEVTEAFNVVLSNPTVGATIADSGYGRIIDDDKQVPELRISDVSVTEGNTGTRTATFTVTLSAASTETVTVTYATTDGTATEGSDYAAATGTLIIPAGQTTGTITVTVVGDRAPEPNEAFFVILGGATNAAIADAQGVGTITDDEPRVSITDVTKSEGKKNQKTRFTFTVTLSVAYDQPVTMSYRTVDGTATAGSGDYLARSGTLTFAPGETTKTITIEVKGDSNREADETFYLDLFGNSSNSLFTKNRGLGTILNDD